MRLENSFEVPVDPERVWSYLLDVERVVVCMPGAELTEAEDDRNFKGKVAIKLGPVSLSFAGKVTMAERDDEERRVVLEGSGMEQRGKGRATVKVTTTVERTDTGSRVQVVQDLQVQGQVASMSRGMMGDVTARLTKQFADCLEATLRADGRDQPVTAAAEAPGASPGKVFPGSSEQATGAPTVPPASGDAPMPGAPVRAPEVRALSLLGAALWERLKGLFGRLFRRGRSSGA